MKRNTKLNGSLLAFGICILTIPSAFLIPKIQIDAIVSSSIVNDFVNNYIVNKDSLDHCTIELIWICSIYFFISLTVAAGYFLFLSRKKLGLLGLIVLLGVEFYILQTPFFIFEVGTNYNCQSDGQTIMAAMESSPKVSLVLIGFGIIYDLINNKKNNNSK